jgi:hypothetical protein
LCAAFAITSIGGYIYLLFVCLFVWEFFKPRIVFSLTIAQRSLHIQHLQVRLRQACYCVCDEVLETKRQSIQVCNVFVSNDRSIDRSSDPRSLFLPNFLLPAIFFIEASLSLSLSLSPLYHSISPPSLNPSLPILSAHKPITHRTPVLSMSFFPYLLCIFVGAMHLIQVIKSTKQQ